MTCGGRKLQRTRKRRCRNLGNGLTNKLSGTPHDGLCGEE